MLLFPCDPLRSTRPDEHFAGEWAAARELGTEVALVDHDAVVAGDVARAVRRVPPATDALYRGWMMRTQQYAAMSEALGRREVTLRTSPAAYESGHELPGWYVALAAFTPESVWTRGSDRSEFEAARTALGPGPIVLRDWVKSMKTHWHEAAFVPDAADGERAWTVASRFRELREEAFTGGFVLRRYERFVSAELRTWWVGGRCRLVTPHPDTPEESPAVDTAFVADAVAGLGLPFVTVDLARRDDGRWRVVELGDGQVSDRPSTSTPIELISILV